MKSKNPNLGLFSDFVDFCRNYKSNFINSVQEFPNEEVSFYKSGNKIKIKKKNVGKFTRYCKGKVTDECIKKGKNSSDPRVRKMATFAANSRTWRH